jgi:peroxiredoxin Q/BCP
VSAIALEAGPLWRAVYHACGGDTFMKRVLAGATLSALIALPAFAALKQGDAAPGFTAKASLAGKEFSYSLDDALKKGPVVVYFYPSAYTGGCNIEAHTFSENAAQFAAAGATVIGVSGDSIERLNAFSADPEYCAGKVAVASDADGAIAKSFDLSAKTAPAFNDTRGNPVDHLLIERTTFVVTPDHKVAATLSSAADKITPAQHVEKSLDVVKQLAAKK